MRGVVARGELERERAVFKSKEGLTQVFEFRTTFSQVQRSVVIVMSKAWINGAGNQNFLTLIKKTLRRHPFPTCRRRISSAAQNGLLPGKGRDFLMLRHTQYSSFS